MRAWKRLAEALEADRFARQAEHGGWNKAEYSEDEMKKLENMSVVDATGSP